MSLDEHLDLPDCKHEGCKSKVHMTHGGNTWGYCHAHRMDVFKK